MAAARMPRSFKLLEELDRGEKGAGAVCSYGLENEDDRDLVHWRATILGPPNSVHENRIYELKIECGEQYPDEPPIIHFVSQINLPGVNNIDGMVDPEAIVLLRDWKLIAIELSKRARPSPETLSLESALLAIRKHMDEHKKLPQPPEGSKWAIYK